MKAEAVTVHVRAPGGSTILVPAHMRIPLGQIYIHMHIPQQFRGPGSQPPRLEETGLDNETG